MNNDFKIHGLENLTNALKELPDKLNIQFFKNFNRKVLNQFIVKNLKQGTAYSAKTKSEIKAISASSGGDKTAMIAGATRKIFYVRFVEGGTKERKTKKDWNRGSIAGSGKMKNIINSNIEPMMKYIREELANDINTFMERKLKRLKK